MSCHLSNHSDVTQNAVAFQFDPTTAVDSRVVIQPSIAITGLAVSAGVNFPWTNPDSLWLALPDGSGGYTNVTPFSFDSEHGNQFRILGNTTDGYTFLQG